MNGLVAKTRSCNAAKRRGGGPARDDMEQPALAVHIGQPREARQRIRKGSREARALPYI